VSPKDRQDQGAEPLTFFTPSEAPEDTIEETGLFDPRPQDVRPWELFERDVVVKEVLRRQPPASAGQDEHSTVSDAQDGAGADGEGADGDRDVESADGHPGSQASGDDAADGANVVDEALAEASPSSEHDMRGGSAEQTEDGRPDSDGSSNADDPEGLLDRTVTGDEPPPPCPNCEATEAAAESTLDATIEALQLPYLEGSEILQRAAQDVSKDFVQNLLRLSVELAATILRRTAELDPETVLGSLDGALDIVGPISELTVRCHPDDAPLLREHGALRAEAITGRLVDITVRPTDSMPRGACIVDFEDGLVDARWDVQLGRLAEAISPALIHHAAEAAVAIAADTLTKPEAVDERSDLAILSEEAEQPGLVAAEASEAPVEPPVEALEATPPEETPAEAVEAAAIVAESLEHVIAESLEEAPAEELPSEAVEEPLEHVIAESLEEDSE
jgi:hypothetical protein